MNPAAVVAALALLVLNGLFVALEFALVGSRHTRIAPLADDGSHRARRALAAMSSLDLQLAGAQLGITMASLGLGIMAEPALAGALAHLFALGPISATTGHTIAFVVALVIITFLHLVIGEMVPKNITLAHPEKTLLALAGPSHAYLVVFKPLLWLLNSSAWLCLRLLGVKPRRMLATTHTAEELAVMFVASHEEGLIEDFAADLLTGVLDFGGSDAASVMVPRDRIAHLGRGATVADAERMVVETGHSRLPVIGRDLDDVRGFIHAKDLLTLPADAIGRPVPLRLVRRMLVAPRDRSLEDLLLSMRRSRVHFALVVDPDGRTVGLVTLEDLLEELVGDILDESDRGAP